MKPRLRSTLLLLVAGVIVGPFFQKDAAPDANTDSEQAIAVEPTLPFFWKLAELQIRRADRSRDLLNTDPRHPGEVLGPLKVGFEAYAKQLFVEAGVRPLILFLPPGADPIRTARKHELPIDRWPENAPPALLLGPSVNTLVVFERASFPKPVHTRFSAAQHPRAGNPPMDRLLNERLYAVFPSTWTPAIPIKHTRCSDPRSQGILVTKLTYDGGKTDSLLTFLVPDDWQSCGLDSDSTLRAAVARQPSRPKAARPVIIASSYLQDSWGKPGPLLSRIVRVR
jgi:hypothetical protein